MQSIFYRVNNKPKVNTSFIVILSTDGVEKEITVAIDEARAESICHIARLALLAAGLHVESSFDSQSRENARAFIEASQREEAAAYEDRQLWHDRFDDERH